MRGEVFFSPSLLNELAALLGLDKSTMSRTVNTMVRHGLVAREPHPEDRRYVKISLTDAGNRVLADIESKMADYYLNIYQSIPQDKRDICFIYASSQSKRLR